MTTAHYISKSKKWHQTTLTPSIASAVFGSTTPNNLWNWGQRPWYHDGPQNFQWKLINNLTGTKIIPLFSISKLFKPAFTIFFLTDYCYHVPCKGIFCNKFLPPSLITTLSAWGYPLPAFFKPLPSAIDKKICSEKCVKLATSQLISFYFYEE